MGLSVNSYCIFGQTYWGVLPLLLRVHFAIFPKKDWKMYIYHDSSLEGHKLENLVNRMNREGWIRTKFAGNGVPKCKAMLWRVIPVWDEGVDFVFCKDADSIPTPRERKIMQHFMQQNKSMMGINDNPSHSIPLMGGMIGFRNNKFIHHTGINTYGNFMNMGYYSDSTWSQHGSDQSYMQNYLFPKVSNDLVLYRTFPGASGIRGGQEQILHVPDTNIRDMNEHVMRIGDICNNYMGACGYAGPLNINTYEEMGKLGCGSVLEFFDKFGDQEVNETIRQEERLLTKE